MDKFVPAVKETGIKQIAIGGEFQHLWIPEQVESYWRVVMDGNLIPKIWNTPRWYIVNDRIVGWYQNFQNQTFELQP
jgi:hypothetical protein